MKVADLTIEQFIALVEEIIDRKLVEYLGTQEDEYGFPPGTSERMRQRGTSGIGPEDEQILKQLGLSDDDEE
jgi:hypothetical protein